MARAWTSPSGRWSNRATLNRHTDATLQWSCSLKGYRLSLLFSCHCFLFFLFWFCTKLSLKTVFNISLLFPSCLFHCCVVLIRGPLPLLHFHTLSILVIFTKSPQFYLSLSLCLWRPVRWQMCVENSFWQLGYSSHLSSWPPECLCLGESEGEREREREREAER